MNSEIQKNSKNSRKSNIHTLNDDKMSYEELQSIALTVVNALGQAKDKYISAEAKVEVLENLLEEAQEAINSRDLILNKYEPKEIDQNFMLKLEELKGFLSDDVRFEEIRKKKMEEMKKKQEEILRAKYNFAPRY